MMSKPSRLVKPSKQARVESLGDRSRMLIVGERLMRAGSEGNLVRAKLNQQQEQNQMKLSRPEPVKSEQRSCAAKDAENLDRKQRSRDRDMCDESSRDMCDESSRDMCDESNRWASRTLPKEHPLAMQTQNSELRREAFLELLKQKYPQHAAVISGHQEQHREHIRSPVHTHIGKQEFLAVMSEGEVPAAFTRGSRTRASLPVVKSSNHTKDKSLGALYLQYGEETRQILMPNEVSSADTVRALFVSAFPQQLTLKMLESPNMAIYMKDHVRNVYYELTDVRTITPHSYLKVYHKDPTQAFNHTPRSTSGDARMSRERMYGTRPLTGGGQSTVHQVSSPQSPIYTVQASLSPPPARSIPSSPSRFTYNPRAMPAGATLPRERSSSSTCTSAILERRDVKPDEDVDPYVFPETRLSMSDIPDSAVFLPHTLYRQKSRKYSESPLSPKSQKTPPLSPHRVNEVRMIDVHSGQNAHVMVERSSSIRRSFRKDSNGTLDAAARSRGSMGSPVFGDFKPSHGERALHGAVSPTDPQRERIRAMEQQIATLTGLLQQAILKGSNTSAVNEPTSEKSISPSPTQSVDSGGISPVAVCKSPPVQSEPPVSPAARDPTLVHHLSTYRKNVSVLRQQLHQLRQTQLQNQIAVRTMLQQAEEKLTERVSDKLRMQEDPVQKQRVKVNEERRRYETMEDGVLIQLGELERHVEQMTRDSKSVSARPVTLRDVEEGAVNLRKVGEALATLKAEFPALQTNMHSVLRVEVEAVRFLKEEPQRMDTMLKRVKALTDTLSSLRICATEGSTHNDQVSLKPGEPCRPEPAQDEAGPRIPSSFKAAHDEPQAPVIAQQVCSSPSSPDHGRDSPTMGSGIPEPKKSSLLPEKLLNSNAATPPIPDRDHAKRNEAVEKRHVEEDVNVNRMLQQAQASLMKNIPDLEVTDREKRRGLNRVAIQPDAVEELKTPVPTPDAVTPAEPVADKPVRPGGSRIQKSPTDQPQRASGEPTKPNQDAVNKSPPPPPPPRKPHLAATGVSTSRTGEVVNTTRKEAAPAQQQEPEEAARQPKPQRVRPEIKPKPRMLLQDGAREREGKEHDEEKIVSELQNTTQQHEDGKQSPDASGSGVTHYIAGTAKSPVDDPLERPEIQSEAAEETVSLAKVARSNASNIFQQPNVLLPSEPTVRALRLEEQSEKESADAQHTYTSLSKPPKHCDAPVVPTEEPIQRSKKRPDNLSLAPAHDKFAAAAKKPSSEGPEAQRAKSPTQENRSEKDGQAVATRTAGIRGAYDDDGSLSPDTTGEEPPPLPDNIAFVITKTRVQALTTGEYQQLVSTRNQDVKTVKVSTDETVSALEDGEFSKKPVIIVFDEPMDIRLAYKRLSTIFEGEEELDRSLSRERIFEDTEEEESVAQETTKERVAARLGYVSGNSLQVPGRPQNLGRGSLAESEDGSRAESLGDGKQEAKKKFKFKFPKKQLAAIGQALRTGTKTGKKTLQVVVYEDEEEADGTLKEGREAKRYEIKVRADSTGPVARPTETSETSAVAPQPSAERTNEICQSTYKTLDSLEETIKELETTISSMDPALSPEAPRKDSKAKRASENQATQEEGSPSKKPAPLGPKPQKLCQKKKPKTQVPRLSASGSPRLSCAKQNADGSSSTSRLPSTGSRQRVGSAEKPPKPQKLQDSQSPFRQVVLL